jgi:hypothetical protein
VVSLGGSITAAPGVVEPPHRCTSCRCSSRASNTSSASPSFLNADSATTELLSDSSPKVATNGTPLRPGRAAMHKLFEVMLDLHFLLQMLLQRRSRLFNLNLHYMYMAVFDYPSLDEEFYMEEEEIDMVLLMHPKKEAEAWWFDF